MTPEELRTTTAAQTLTAHLRTKGLRCTIERYMVLQTALAMKGHFTTEELAGRLSADGYRVALATVYSTLPLLIECSFIRPLFVAGGVRLYETCIAGHHHLVCNVCGKIKDVRDSALDEHLRAKRYSAFTPQQFSITAFGICSACARKARKNKKEK